MTSDSSEENGARSESGRGGFPVGTSLRETVSSKPDDDDSHTIVFSVQEDNAAVEKTIRVRKDYSISEQIARGGMGRIFSAGDSVLDRDVAVKLSTSGETGRNSRLWKEGTLLAKLAHPNIVPIYNLGQDSSGRPFYSMKLIRGRTLMQVIRLLANGDEAARARYTLNRLITIFRKVCDGVAFAHSKGYLHRDIKPENVMLGEFGEVLLMDWGLAQEISPLPSEKSKVNDLEEQVTQAYVEGTPEYMSPEQTRGERLDVRSDVYSLGGLLHTLLSYGPPFRAKNVPELLLKVRKGEIQPIRKPRVNTSLRSTDSKNAGVPIALQAVTRKAMALHRERRYQSVEEMVRDIEAYQNGFATTAEEAGLLRQISLFLQRQIVASALAAALLVGAVLFVVHLTTSERQARQSEARAQQEAIRANFSTAEALKQADIAAANARQVIEEQKLAQRSTAAAQMSIAETADEDSNGQQMQSALNQIPEDLRDQPWHYLSQKLDTSDLQIEAEEGGTWKDCVPDPLDPKMLLTLQANGWIRSLNLNSGAMVDIFRIDVSGLKSRLAVSSDGKRIAVYRRLTPPSGQLLQIDAYAVPSGELQCSITFPINRQPLDAAPLTFSRDGNMLLLSAAFAGSGVYMFDAWKGDLLWKSEDDARAYAGFSKDSERAMVASSKSGFTEREPWSGQVLRSVPKAKLEGNRSIQTTTPSWNHIFSLVGDVIRKVELDGGGAVANFPLKSGAFFQGDIAFLPKAKILAVVTDQLRQSASLQLWEAEKATLLRSLPILMAPSGIKRAEEFRWEIVAAPQTNQLIVIRGTHMKVWRVEKVLAEQSFPMDPANGFDNFTFTRTPGSSIAPQVNGGNSNFLSSLRPVQIGKLAGLITFNYSPEAENVHQASASVVTSDAAGHFVCSSIKGADSNASALKLRRIDSEGVADITIPAEKPLSGHAHLSPNGERIWGGNIILDLAQGKRVIKVDRSDILEPEFKDRTPRWVGNSDVAEIVLLEKRPTTDPNDLRTERSIMLWNATDGTRRNAIPAQNATSLSPSPDGRQIAEGGSDKKVRIRDGSTLAVQKNLRVHDGAVTSVAWHPKLPLLATASEDHTVRVWDLNTDTMVEKFGLFDSSPDRLFWSPDGTTLAVRCRGTSTQIDILHPKVCQQQN